MMGGRRQRRSVRPAMVAMLCALGLMIAGWPVVAKMRRSPGPSVEPTQRAAVSRADGAVADWAAHVQAVADLLSGTNTGAAVGNRAGHRRATAERLARRLNQHEAQQMWLGLYRVAPVNIEKFGAVERVYRNHTRGGPAG